MTLSVFKNDLVLARARLARDPRARSFATKFGYRGDYDKAPSSLADELEALTNLSATSITNNADLVIAQQGFRAALLESAVGQIDPLIDLAYEVKSTHTQETHIALGDLPQMEEWTNERIMSTLDVAATIPIINKKWQSSIRVNNDDLRDDNLGLLPPHIAGMGEEAALQPGNLVARMMCNGFDGANSTLGNGLAFDGYFFFSASHPTGSNLLTEAFSVNALNDAIVLLRSQKRFDGLNLYAKPTHLIVGIDNEQAAIKALSAEYLATQFGGAAATESNVLRNRFELVVSPIIPTGEWFVADLSKKVKPMLFQNRQGIQTQIVGGPNASDFVAFSYDQAWFGATSRNNAGYWDFRRVVGSKPS